MMRQFGNKKRQFGNICDNSMEIDKKVRFFAKKTVWKKVSVPLWT